MFESAMSTRIDPVTFCIALIASATAAALVTRQLLTKRHLIRKYDVSATGGLFKGEIVKLHWSQPRPTAEYKPIVFSLPSDVYRSLDLTSDVETGSADLTILARAVKARPGGEPAQACWASLIEDFVNYLSLNEEPVDMEKEATSHVPEHLNAVPIKVDALTLLLHSIALGMEVYKYSPTTGQIVLSSSTGTIFSSPPTTRQLHCSYSPGPPSIGTERALLHGRALRHEKGVWANAVFGRFRDRSYRSDFNSFEALSGRKYDVLENEGWPRHSYQDTVAGAACFMFFAFVDCYLIVPPSAIERYCAHFAEVILKIQHWDVISEMGADEQDAVALQLDGEFEAQRSAFIDSHGASSPFLHWESIPFPFLPSAEGRPDADEGTPTEPRPNYTAILTPPSLLSDLAPLATQLRTDKDAYKLDKQDPSAYLSPQTSWELIQRLDQSMHQLSGKSGSIRKRAEEIAARAVAPLAEAGAPSFGKRQYREVFDSWEGEFEKAVEGVCARERVRAKEGGEMGEDFTEEMRRYAWLMLLRAAYFTVMMRAAHGVGPGLKMEMKAETGEFWIA